MTTWEEIFGIIDLEWCRMCDRYEPLHKHGWLEGANSIFHWRERRMSHPSAHKAFRQIVIGTRPDLAALPLWRGTYLRNLEIHALARATHIRFPRSAFDLDRARMRFLLGEYTEADRRRMTPSEQTDFTAALRWAARS